MMTHEQIIKELNHLLAEAKRGREQNIDNEFDLDAVVIEHALFSINVPMIKYIMLKCRTYKECKYCPVYKKYRGICFNSKFTEMGYDQLKLIEQAFLGAVK